jgi:hypothetical protein
MSTTIRLDSTAMRVLIEQDPEFKLELQRAVVSETVRNLFLKDVGNNVVKIIEATFKQQHQELVDAVKQDEGFRKGLEAKLSGFIQSIRGGSYGYADQKKLSPELQTLMNKRVGELVNEGVEKAVGSINNRVKEAEERISATLLAKMERITDRLETATKEEMALQIREDVSKILKTKLG